MSLSGLMSTEPNSALRKIKLSDAQWMLKKMCLITKDQITQTLIFSGMSSAEVVLATEKLLSRRNKMIEDFSMQDELGHSCFVKVNKKINYNPDREGLVTTYSELLGRQVQAPSRGQRVVNGVVK